MEGMRRIVPPWESVWGLGFGLWVLGFWVWVLGLGVRLAAGLGFEVWGLVFGV